ncbi:MAG: tRNA (adenosine(37)-N6)-dimethylallyltransferase MiaA [Bacteroidales bacterium]|nr:tRNA (adenosine(37)-N6)-dimethylallyltransferase MiaA [Bacteroidales bacterium]
MITLKNRKKFLVVIAGPTASGKTSVAIQLAKHFNTEIVSADSRQFYREMSIGTAVPSKKQLEECKHHFIQHISIKRKYDVGAYEKDALTLLDELFKSHDVVVLTGGSGLFIDAVCRGLDNIPDISLEVRNKVTELFDSKGIVGLLESLTKLDPAYYDIVDKQNPRRLQRALEVCFQTGLTYSYYRKRETKSRKFDVIWTALLVDRMDLINRINHRVEDMMAAGQVEEAKKLFPHRHLNALNTVGYQELFDYFEGKCTITEAVENIKVNTRQYAKRQMTWFRKNKDYHWLFPTDTVGLINYVSDRISQD